MVLSPGKYHLKVPKDAAANLRFRRHLLTAAATDPRVQAALREACRLDFLFFVNVFVWQYNPRQPGAEVGPFVSWDFQDESVPCILGAIEDQDDMLIEKSREMGATWWFLIAETWLWLFHGWKKFHNMSRNEKAVEADDPDCLFWKIDFLLAKLPTWLLPKKSRRNKLFFGNDDNGSTVTGDASTGKAGVGGRATAMFIDEFSQIKEDYEVLHRTSDTTSCRIFNGTHLGLDTAFYELSQRVDMKKLVWHWTLHPEKKRGLYRAVDGKLEILDKIYEFRADYPFVLDGTPSGGPCPGLRSPWYDQQCRRKGSTRAVAMDLDIDPKGSVSQFFDPMTIRVLRQLASAPKWQGDLHFERDTGKPQALVASPAGRIRMWLVPVSDRAVPLGKYAAGADLATGSGATNSCVSIINALTGQKVLEYASPDVRPEALAPLAVALCRLFRTEAGDGAMFAWEQQGPGLLFGKAVVDLGYRNIYYKTDEFELTKTVSDTPGWYPSPNNKRLLLEEYRAALQGRQFANPSDEALATCLAFRYGKGGVVEHGGEAGGQNLAGARVNHGDLVIADALAWKMAQTFYVGQKREEENEPPPLSLAWRMAYHKRQEQTSEW